MEIVHQMQVLRLDLLVQRLDEITRGNQPDQFASLDHRQLADVMTGQFCPWLRPGYPSGDR